MALDCRLRDLDKMNPAKARVLAAKDALKRLRYRQVSTGKYLGNDWQNTEDVITLSKKDSNSFIDSIDARKYVNQLEKNCPSCALGNLFLSHIRLFNNVNLAYSAYERNTVASKLEQYFSQKQLDMIECAFEGKDVCGRLFNYEEKEKCKTYYLRYSDEKKRLRAILINIIKNKGTFVPTYQKLS